MNFSVTAHPPFGLPYGRYPRLLLAWITTEAVRTKDRQLQLGPSLSRFMVRLGLTPSGGPNGPIGRLRGQMQRLFGATIAFTWDAQSEGEWHDAGFRVARESHLWWDPQGPEQAVAWRSTVKLSQGFFEAITERPVPIDLRALRALRSPLALDLYLWLTYRNSYLRRPTRVPWALLALQLGAEYRDQRDFKRKVLRSLNRVLVVYPAARVQQVRGGLRPKARASTRASHSKAAKPSPTPPPPLVSSLARSATAPRSTCALSTSTPATAPSAGPLPTSAPSTAPPSSPARSW